MSDTERIKEGLLRKHVSQPIRKADLLSTGSTLLNLACTGHWQGGFAKGRYYFIVGDSQSGKTFLSLTCFAEAAINLNFDDYRLIFDDVEGGALMDIERYFGRRVARRLESPASESDGSPIYSQTLDQFYFYIYAALKQGRPFVWVLDSMDALSSSYEGRKFEEKAAAHKKGTKVAGDYGDGKAQLNSRNMRVVLAGLRATGSILIVVNQTRDNVGAGMFEPRKTRSGGHALTFYATLELWAAIGGVIKKEVNEKKRQVGIKARIRVRKNRVTGKDRTVLVPIHNSYGIDDITGCIDFIIEEGHWKMHKGGQLDAPEFQFTGTRVALVRKIIEEGLETDLRVVTQEVWDLIEGSLVLNRPPRYGDNGEKEKQDADAYQEKE